MFLLLSFIAGAACWAIFSARLRGAPKIAHALDTAAGALDDAILLRDRAGLILAANPACARLFGMADARALTGHSLSDFLPAATPERLALENTMLDKGETGCTPLTLMRPGCRPLTLDVRVHSQHDAVLVQLRDISAYQATEEALRQRVMLDEVTQLPNRRMLMEQLAQAIALGKRGGGTCAVMLIDLDHFKRVNEAHGHTLGDAMLVSAANRLRETLRQSDTVARFGGDEFVVILMEADPDTAPLRVEFAAQRVVEAFQQPLRARDIEVVMTASVGIATWPADGEDEDTLIRNADTAMYEVKKSTRNGFCLFNRDMNLRVQNILRVDAHLRSALDNKELRVVFQPIVDANTHCLCKLEALLRWRSAALGEVRPDQFIPVAEETGQILRIGAWVLEESCRRLLSLQMLRPEDERLTLSVNVSARQLHEQDFAMIVSDILRRTGLPAAQLELELTEGILIKDDPNVMNTLAALREQGVRLSLDDFGTGYSSLSYLTRFPLNTVKLDRAFVRDIDSNPQSLQLATAIIAMCGSLGLDLVAEGVETLPQADLLRTRGCQFLQGYYFGKPVNPDELAAAPARMPA